MDIKKVKLVKGEFPYIEFTREDGTLVMEDHELKAHKDLIQAFDGFKIHAALISNLVKTKQVKKIDDFDPTLVADIRVSGFSIGGKVDEEGITLMVIVTTPSGKTYTFNTPFTRFVEAEESAYRYMEELQKVLSKVDFEVRAYMGGKVAPDPQQNLFPEGKEESPEDENED